MNSIDMDIGHGLLSSNAEIGLFEHSKDASKVASAILDSGHSENAREFELVSSIDKFSNHRSNAKLADSNLPVKRIVGKDYYADIPMLYLSDLLGNRQDVESSLLSSRTKFISKSPFKVRHLCEMGGCSK